GPGAAAGGGGWAAYSDGNQGEACLLRAEVATSTPATTAASRPSAATASSPGGERRRPTISGSAYPGSRQRAVLAWVRRQRVQTRALTMRPFNTMCADCRLGRKRRLVWTLEWLTLWPVMGRLPQTSQRWDIAL